MDIIEADKNLGTDLTFIYLSTNDIPWQMNQSIYSHFFRTVIYDKQKLRWKGSSFVSLVLLEKPKGEPEKLPITLVAVTIKS